MTRKVVDCRDFPSETNCALTISGREMEVLQAAAEHAASTHGHVDGPELRKQLHAMMKEKSPRQPDPRAPFLRGAFTGFVDPVFQSRWVQ